MTTTIYDRHNRLVATDTRWSLSYPVGKPEYLIFVDDCEFEKIADLENASMILAGDGRLIAKWKQWWYESLDEDNLPPTDIGGKNSIVLLIIDKVNNCIIFDCGQKLCYTCTETNEIQAVFSGSGGHFAANCWIQNSCARTAIETASLHDMCTSNVVKFIDFVSKKTNVGDPSFDYNVIVNSIIQGGYIMALPQSQPVRLKESPLAEEIHDLLAKGDLVASAPSPKLNTFTWGEKEKGRLRAAIKTVKKLEGIK